MTIKLYTLKIICEAKLKQLLVNFLLLALCLCLCVSKALYLLALILCDGAVQVYHTSQSQCWTWPPVIPVTQKWRAGCRDVSPLQVPEFQGGSTTRTSAAAEGHPTNWMNSIHPWMNGWKFNFIIIWEEIIQVYLNINYRRSEKFLEVRKIILQ